MSRDITNLEQMLDQIDKTPDVQGRVELGMLVETTGGRSFGPMLLLTGVILASPVGGIPGMPTSMGLLVLLMAGQLLFGKEHIWLPSWLLKRSISRKNVGKISKWLRPPARFIDRLLRPRLPIMINGVARFLIAFICIVVAIGMPMMELVPFSVHGAGIALTAFGLSMIARDGLLALVAFIMTAAVFGSGLYHLLD